MLLKGVSAGVSSPSHAPASGVGAPTATTDRKNRRRDRHLIGCHRGRGVWHVVTGCRVEIGKVGQVEAAINVGVSPGQLEVHNATPYGVVASDAKSCLESEGYDLSWTEPPCFSEGLSLVRVCRA